MTGVVLDASLTISGLLGDAKPADRVYAQADVPATWSLEIANVLARAEANDILSEAQSEAFLEMLAGMPIHADESTSSQTLADTLHLARRYRLSSYDASYLELALRLGHPLATLDADLAKAARRAGVKKFMG